jgi:RNA polymerase sigma-70 factor (ECF subfamily)
MDDDDAALVAQIGTGSQRAFNLLIDRHQQAVRGFLRRLLTNAADAEDIAQETFLAAWEGAANYRGGASVRSWLCAIAWHKAKSSQRSWFRRRARETHYQLAADPEQGASPEDRIAVMQALRILPIEQRAAVVLCLAQGFSHSEAAEALGAPLGTVKSHVARGKARLLEILHQLPEHHKGREGDGR